MKAFVKLSIAAVAILTGAMVMASEGQGLAIRCRIPGGSPITLKADYVRTDGSDLKAYTYGSDEPFQVVPSAKCVIEPIVKHQPDPAVTFHN